MLELNQHVCDSLRQVGLEPQIHPPHIWAKNTGVDFHGDLGRFEHQEPGKIHVTFGDVVDVDGDAKVWHSICVMTLSFVWLLNYPMFGDWFSP